MVDALLEGHAVRQFIFGMVVITGMFVGVRVGAELLLSVNVPFGDWLGSLVGALFVFLVVSATYGRKNTA
jgi:CDP-diglyceride synthetase